VRAQAVPLIDGLASAPRPPRAKELRDRPDIYRLWLARNWRIAHEVDEESKVIIILRVRRKEYIDYESL
jgi:mRNA-degrading endonuclease RelE of RelBE toxin-antitoxin system